MKFELNSSLVNCGFLSDPLNGLVSMTDTVMGSTANYSCNSGYDLVGNVTTVCQANGIWSEGPVCRSKCNVMHAARFYACT